MALRKLVRSKATQKFLTPAGDWTDDIGAAGDFKTKARIEEACSKFKLRDVDLYFSFSRTECLDVDITLPLN